MSTRMDENFLKKFNSQNAIVPHKVVEDQIAEEEN